MPGGDDPTASASPGTPAPTVTVTVAATPPPADPATGPDYGFTFFGEAQMGATWVAMDEQLRMPVAGLDECPHYGPLWETALATTYAFTDPETPGAGAAFFYTNRFQADAGAPFPRNAEGVGVGSTMAELTAAYSDGTTDSVEDLGAELLHHSHRGRSGERLEVRVRLLGRLGHRRQAPVGADAGAQWSHLCGGL